MKKLETQTMDSAALATKHRQLKKEAMNLRFQQAMGQLENTAQRRTVRRQIAKILTALTNQRRKNAKT